MSVSLYQPANVLSTFRTVAGVGDTESLYLTAALYSLDVVFRRFAFFISFVQSLVEDKVGPP